MNKSLILPLFLALITVILGCARKDPTSGNAGPVKVIVQKARAVNGSSKHYIGIIEESLSVPLSFPVSGTVEKVLVKEGQQVKHGELLASLDSRSYRNTLDMAEAKEIQAEDAHKRLSELYRKGSLPEVKFIEVETGLTQARAAAELAQKNLADCNLFAPAGGIIGRRSLEPGENAVPFQTVFTLVNVEQVDIKVAIPEKEIAGIAIGDEATITVPALNDEVFSGKVNLKGVMAQPISHTYDIKIQLRNQDHQLLPGMVCRVDFSGDDQRSLAVIPVQVIQTDGNGNRYILKPNASGDKVSRQSITTGALLGLDVVIITGLQPGEEYVAEGYQHIDTTMNIQILKKDEKR